MTEKIIEVIASHRFRNPITALGEEHGATDVWTGPEGPDGRCSFRILMPAAGRQELLDALQSMLAGSEDARIVMQPAEVTLPAPEPPQEQPPGMAGATATREEIYSEIERGARLDRNYLFLVLLSAIVAAIGLIEDSVAIVVGAMVIAPLLGPNLGLALATSLGDTQLAWQSLKSNMAGLGTALGFATLIGVIWQPGAGSGELVARTVVGLDSVALALASGAAAVLSLTTGIPTALVGVMVAVALMPPAVAFGMMLGAGHGDLAAGAGLLLAVNIVCVNLAAKLVFLTKGVTPRTWMEKRKARHSMWVYMLFWMVTLAVLIVAIFLRQQLA